MKEGSRMGIPGCAAPRLACARRRVRWARWTAVLASVGLMGSLALVDSDPAAAATLFEVTASVSVARYPYGVAVDPTTHNVYVTNYDSNTVSVIDESGDAHTGTIVNIIPVAFPAGVAV